MFDSLRDTTAYNLLRRMRRLGRRQAPRPPPSEPGLSFDGENFIADPATLKDALHLTPHLERVLTEVDIDPNFWIGCLINVVVHQGKTIFEVYREIGSTLVSLGRSDLAKPFFETYIGFGLDDPEGHSSYLHCLMLHPDSTDAELLAAHRAWSQRYETRSAVQTPRNFPEKAVLNIAYVCHFFGAPTIDNSIHGVMAAHNRDLVKVFAYNDGAPMANPGNTADVWRDSGDLDDEAFARQVREDDIDILFEVNGHIASNRYNAIAGHPARIQVNLGNYPATTGFRAMDFTIADEIVLPPENEEYYSEQVERLQCVTMTTTLDEQTLPPVAEAPVRTNGFVTFGNFGATHKMSLISVELWSRVLHSVAKSRLVLKSVGLGQPSVQRATLGIFERFGINADRLELRGPSSYQDLLNEYADIDISLDNFPMTGGSTMADSLRMGVPCLTLSGDRWASREGHTILQFGGLGEFVARTPQDYLDTAIALAADHDKLEELRRTLRSRLSKNLFSGSAVSARELEQACRRMYERARLETIGSADDR